MADEGCVSAWGIDASVRAYLIERASSASLTLKSRKSTAMMCPEDACMSQKSVGILRASETALAAALRLEGTHYLALDVYKHLYSTNTQSRSSCTSRCFRTRLFSETPSQRLRLQLTH